MVGGPLTPEMTIGGDAEDDEERRKIDSALAEGGRDAWHRPQSPRARTACHAGPAHRSAKGILL